MNDDFPMRLNKFLAQANGISRRQADELIERGRVTVDGTVAILGGQVDQGSDVRVDGRPVSTEVTHVYVAMHKPRGYVCSRKRQGDTPTIYELIPEKYRTLKTVGRLDRDSSGLILLTNDGDFAQRMTHPSHRKTKVYEVMLNIALEPLHQQMISDFGVDLDDGKSQMALERLSDDRLHWRVTMSEGRNRQIRRTFAALGYTVTSLHRTHFGAYALDNLAEGELLEVTML